MDCGIDGITFTEPSLCKSEFAADCDLKTIIKRFMTHGILPPDAGGFSADVSLLPDSFDEMMANKAVIQQRFEALPLAVQQQFESAEDWYLKSLEERDKAASRLSETPPPETPPPETPPPVTPPPVTAPPVTPPPDQG